MELGFNLYLALAINGFFTGMGTILASHIYEVYMKKRLEGTRAKVQRIIKETKGG